jgi:flavin-binding protein dodecin
MSVVKVIELVGQSERSWEDAVQTAVHEAAKTVRNITGVEVLNWTGDVSDAGDITSYRADVQIALSLPPDAPWMKPCISSMYRSGMLRRNVGSSFTFM